MTTTRRKPAPTVTTLAAKLAALAEQLERSVEVMARSMAEQNQVILDLATRLDSLDHRTRAVEAPEPTNDERLRNLLTNAINCQLPIDHLAREVEAFFAQNPSGFVEVQVDANVVSESYACAAEPMPLTPVPIDTLWTVTYTFGADGPLWSADTFAPTAEDAKRSVRYMAQRTATGEVFVVAAIDCSSIR